MKCQVLSRDRCDEFLDWSTNNRVQVRPEILCVGKIHQWKVETYYLSKKGKFMLIPKNHKGKQFHKKFLKFHYGAKHSHIEGNDHSYVASAGTCNGDSGGPLFRSENGKNIVTGKMKFFLKCFKVKGV